MMTLNFLHYCKRLILIMLILVSVSSVLLSQKNLSGNINQPKTHVVSISTDRVIVDNVTGFSVNDTILLIQMQGVQILTASTYGNVQNKVGEPGMHEFLIILSINSGTREIVFRNNILKTYDATGNIQIVRVPYYNSAVVTGKLFCAPWDPVTKSGGVFSIIVGRTLTLNADIDVSSLGFKGGKDTIGAGICWSTNTVLYGREYYARSFTNAGFKGEGVANLSEFNQPLTTNFMKGLGNNWTGGGGGNGRYSGGGGGSNRGAGGTGGLEDCFPPLQGGNGGLKAVHGSFSDDRIYMGGGGGASTTSPTGSSSNGGGGGGIVIIVADAIIGNGGNILADGGNGGNETGIGGSGGAGAGGSIALSLNSYGSSPIKFSLLGGNGGSNPGTFGEGGGGGGGLLYVSTNTPANVTNVFDGGLAGNNTTSTASAGAVGEKKVGFKAVLNGFLFNSISSSVTGNQVDSICSNMLPKVITGTKPVGGTGPYTYLWEKSYNQVTWIPLANDPDPTNYTPTVIETATVWFRRTITDSSVPAVLVDVSKPVRIVVQPFIKNNIVGNSDTICFAQNPVAFTSQAVLQDGNGKYTFDWKVSLNNSVYAVPANSHSSQGYTPPPALTITSWYRRTVTSGRCIDSTAIVKITVLDTLRNNKILNSPPDICFGMSFANITATTTPSLTGGDNTYRFKWESNINGAGWATAPGANTAPGYNPVELPQRIPSNQYIFRRVVYSGSNDVCSSVSNAVLLTDFPVILNNTVATVAATCSGSVPANLVGSKSPVLSGGNGIYTYSWQDSSKVHSWALITGATGADFQPPILTDTTSYRRIVNSTACSDISKSVRVIVHKPILNNNISVLSGGVTQTICNNQIPAALQGTAVSGGTGFYTYLWKVSTDNSVFTAITTGATSPNYAPAVLTATRYYLREVTSGACTVTSNSITITVLPDISNNTITGNAKVCYGLVPDLLTGATLAGGSGVFKYLWQQSTDGGVNWNSANGTNISSSYQPPALISAAKYRRVVTSGLNDCCTSVSNVFNIGIDPLPSSKIYAGPDTIIYSVEKLYHMKALAPLSSETGTWSMLGSGTNSVVFDNVSGNVTVVRDLTIGNNSFLWTISNGPCHLSDSVSVVLLEDFIPQGFSPNGDAWNNKFIIEGLNSSDDQYVDLSIVNGAGTEVFSTTNRPPQKWADWDGKNLKGLDLPEGTYYYMLKVTSRKPNGPVFKKSGFIVLKRY
jgi:hypothetical protein